MSKNTKQVTRIINAGEKFIESLGLSIESFVDYDAAASSLTFNVLEPLRKVAAAFKKLPDIHVMKVHKDKYHVTCPYGIVEISTDLDIPRKERVTTVVMIHDDDARSAYDLARSLAQFDPKITPRMFDLVARGEGKNAHYRRVGRVAEQILGSDAYAFYDENGHLAHALEYRFGLRKNRHVDGIDLRMSARALRRASQAQA